MKLYGPQYDDLNTNSILQTFATKNHLEYHENRHNNIQHTCNECGRTFLSRISLKKHARSHTNDFKYICDHCDMKFYNKSEMVLHMYSHKKVPLPFQCDACDKTFSAKFKLNQHVETHKGNDRAEDFSFFDFLCSIDKKKLNEKFQKLSRIVVSFVGKSSRGTAH